MRMKITEVEANAEELKASNSLAGNLSRLLATAFAPKTYTVTADYDEAEEENEDDD